MVYKSQDYRSQTDTVRSGNMVTKVTKFKRVYHYSLNSSTQEEFNNVVKLNKAKEGKVAGHPIRRSLGQLTPSNVLTIKGYYDVKGTDLTSLRSSLYRFASLMNLHIETAFSKDKRALLVRLNRNWPVGVDINPS